MTGADPDRLRAHLTDRGVTADVVPYPAAATVDDGRRRRGDLPGSFTRNVLLGDAKDSLLFVTAPVDRRLEDDDRLNVHPVTHTESIRLSRAEFATVTDPCRHPPLIVELTE